MLDSGDVHAALSRLAWPSGREDDVPSGARSLVEAFVRERERLRQAHRGLLDLVSPDEGGACRDDERYDSNPARPSPPDVRPAGSASIPALGHPGRDIADDASFNSASRRAAGRPEDASVRMQRPNGAQGERSALRAGPAVMDGGSAAAGGAFDSADDRPTGEFHGTAPAQRDLDLRQALVTLDALEQELLDAWRRGDLSATDWERLEAALGEGAREVLNGLEATRDALVAAGYVQLESGRLELTARGLRQIGQKALDDIFHALASNGQGDHPMRRHDVNAGAPDGHKRYDSGDHFLLDLNRTLLNAVERLGPVKPIALAVEDFEVVRSDRLTQASTVLLLDVSPSMPLRGCLAAGRKVALALNALIETRFPRDRLYLVAFSGHARMVRPGTLHRLGPHEHEYGTNMEHALALARRLLARHRGSRQIVLITDGEPTAHLEGDRVCHAYPPTERTRERTLREVRRCARENIVINTFMLDHGPELVDFVDELTRINRGRAFFTGPQRLGEYVVTNYVRGRQTPGNP